MSSEGTRNGNGYEHAGGYQPATPLWPSRRDLLTPFCSAVSIIAVTSLYNDYLVGRDRHFLGLALGLTLALSLWILFSRRRSWQASDWKRRALFFAFTIVLSGFLAYAYCALRDAGGWA